MAGRGVTEHLDARLLRRLLKLMQRNRGLNPPKEIYNRWNDFCDTHAPATHSGGPATRDPKFLSQELILGFLADLPRSFWVNLVKKVQGEGKESRLAEAWEGYCDQHAPPRQGQTGRAIRDPRHLAQEFLIGFVSATLERDDQRGHSLASIIDSYQFDFDHGRNIRHTEREERPGGRRGGGKGGHPGRPGRHEQENEAEEEGMEFDPEADPEEGGEMPGYHEEEMMEAPEEEYQEGEEFHEGMEEQYGESAPPEMQAEGNEPC